MKSTEVEKLNRHPVVLLIEDEPGDARLIEWQLLERDPHAFVVHTARSMSSAQALIDQQGLRPDVVLLDLNLPDSFGIASVERCRQFIEAPIVVLTGLDDTSATQAAIQSGAEDYLTKGGDGASLRRSVRYAMLRHTRDADARLTATVFSHAHEGIMITEADGVIIDVNDTFTSITGYPREAVIGHKPNLLKSGQHSEEFYAGLWRKLLETGQWQGEITNRHNDGALYTELLTISAVPDGHGKVRHYVGLFSDISKQKAQEKHLEFIAHYDALTRLPNRILLSDRMHQAMSQSRRRELCMAVAYIDLDGFKQINDQHGHQAGDQLLMTVAARMTQVLREGDTLARIGGDEFVALLIDLKDSASIPLTLNRLLQAAAQPVRIGDRTLQVSASVGMTLYPQTNDIDADQLLRQADQAMYQAKLAGKNRFATFDVDQDLTARAHHETLERIRLGLAEREFVLHYQPKVNMRTGEFVGVEALLRWQHPQRGLLLPAAFLEVAEEHSLAITLGEWVIDTALRQIEDWQDQGLAISISVNVGARQLQQPDFFARLLALLAAHPTVRPQQLELEVLETSALEDIRQVSEVMLACHNIGIAFALDDFGTGYSSLTYLKRLPAKRLKIDRAFVSDMLDDPEDLAILEGIIGLAAAFRREVIAEGVENVAQGEMLLQLGCDFAQGFGISRPLLAEAVPDWIKTWRPDPAWARCRRISRDKLPLIFASVEHRAWILAIEKSIQDLRLSPPPMNEQQCRFGEWLTQQGRALYSANPAFQSIDELHRQVHQQANALLSQQTEDDPSELNRGLATLHGLRNEMTEQLRKLLNQS